jgi:hypothetical protein
MGRLSALLLALILGGAGAGAWASCGGGSDAKLLPGSTASQIESNLEEVRQLAANDDCIGAEDAVATVAAEVEELNNVAPKLKAALQEGTAKLSEVVGRCEEETEETEPTVETAVEPEEVEDEKEKKPKKEKPDKEKPAETEEEPSEGEGPELPPQANGKGKGLENGQGPPENSGGPSGGVGPSTAVEGE